MNDAENDEESAYMHDRNRVNVASPLSYTSHQYGVQEYNKHNSVSTAWKLALIGLTLDQVKTNDHKILLVQTADQKFLLNTFY